MLITSSKSSRSGVRKRTINRTVHVGPLTLRFITLIMFAAVVLFYLAQSTQSATKRYEVRELEMQKTDLTKGKQRLEVEAARLKSLPNISESASKLGLEQNK